MMTAALVVSILCNLFFVFQWYRIGWCTIRLAGEMTELIKKVRALEARGVLDVERHLAESPHLTLEAIQRADGAALTREDVRLEVVAALKSSRWECTLRGRDEELKMDAAFEVSEPRRFVKILADGRCDCNETQVACPIGKTGAQPRCTESELRGRDGVVVEVKFGDMRDGQHFLGAADHEWVKCGVDRAHLASDVDRYWGGIGADETYRLAPRPRFGDLAIGTEFSWRGEIWEKMSGLSARAMREGVTVAQEFSSDEEVTPCS